MADQAGPPGADPAIPSVAGMWDYYLGGNENTDADRDAARLVLGAAPDVPLAALENREFLKHAVRFLAAESGISQFIDIGPGLPTRGNVHQLVREHNPRARVAYIDNDPVVIARGGPHLDGLADVVLISGDLRDPDGILGNPELRRIIDFSRPVALSMTLLLHFVRDEEDPYGCVGRLCAAICAGSYLVISHVTCENRDEAALGQITGAYDQATAPIVMRTKDEVERFFAGFEIVEPGIVFLSQWRPSIEYYAGGGTRWVYAGTGRKP
ncbi:MAG: SAM-dependent methyltransferase [Streptosporangiaceae bacterium]